MGKGTAIFLLFLCDAWQVGLSHVLVHSFLSQRSSHVASTAAFSGSARPMDAAKSRPGSVDSLPKQLLLKGLLASSYAAVELESAGVSRQSRFSGQDESIGEVLSVQSKSLSALSAAGGSP